MTAVDILKFPINSPADLSPLHKLQEAGYNASQILAVIGKTEGNGCVNDFSRTLASHVWEAAIPPNAITVFSGGTEGVLSPHVTIFVHTTQPTGLTIAVGRTPPIPPAELGTIAHSQLVAQTISDISSQLHTTPEHTYLVLVKCPLLTSAKISAISAAGDTPVTTDTYESMAKSRYASALGVGLALDEIRASDLPFAFDSAEGYWSTKASCSSGAELEDCHIIVLASDSAYKGSVRLGAVSATMEDAIDAASILRLTNHIQTLHPMPMMPRVVQVFAKAEASPNGVIRGNRHTMLTDSDIHSTRHARAAVGGLIAGLVGDCMIYVSGGAEGQGPAGGGTLCIVYSVEIDRCGDLPNL